MMWYELKEIFLVVKMCYIIVMYVILYEILKIYFGSKIMYVFLKYFLGLGLIKEWMNFIGRNNFV